MSVNKYLKIAIIFILICLLGQTQVLGFDSVYVWSPDVETMASSVDDTASSIYTEANATPVTVENLLNLESASSVLLDQNTGQVLYEHNSHEQLRPASVTKIMSILLIMEAIDSGRIQYTDKVACSETAAAMGGSQIWLDVREELTVDEMLKAICVVSANDCTVAMAEYIAGSQELFVQQMNERAKELGMKDTTFKNCHGIDEDGHVTSSYDIALMSRELMRKYPDIIKYTTIWMDSLRDGKSELVNTNKLVRNYTGATGLKTGSTSLALYNLSATATRNNLSLIAVIMKSPSSAVRFNEARKLLDYGFSNYEYKQFGKKGETVLSIPVEKGIEEHVDAIFKEDSGILIKKGDDKNVTENISLPEFIPAPVKAGDKLGEITYSNTKGTILTTEIIAKSDARKVNFANMLTHVYQCWITLNRS